MISTLKEFEQAKIKGYTASINTIASMLDVSKKTAETYTAGVERIEIAETLFHKIKHTEQQASRTYYNEYEVVRHLVEQGHLRVFYGDAREVYSRQATDGTEKELEAKYLIDNLFTVYMLLKVSKRLHQIIIEDLGYEFKKFDDDMRAIYKDKDGNAEYESDIVDKQLEVKYRRMIKRSFYFKFKIGKRSIKYFQSMRTVKAHNMDERIKEMIENAERGRLLTETMSKEEQKQ